MVRDLALDLGRRLEVLAGEDFAADSLVEAALAADRPPRRLQPSRSPRDDRPLAVAAVHLAAGATRALIPLVESKAGTLDGPYAENTLRDVRSAGWRADLAVRQHFS